MRTTLQPLMDFLMGIGIENIDHTNKTYLGHLVGVHRLMEVNGCTEELCRAGMFHSIYGTESFQGFTLALERRPEVRTLIGERAERLAYLNCAMDRSTLDRNVEQDTESVLITDRLSGNEVLLSREDFDDLCRVHLYDWLEQVPRCELWSYRREAYRGMAHRLGGPALQLYNRVFAGENVPAGMGASTS